MSYDTDPSYYQISSTTCKLIVKSKQKHWSMQLIILFDKEVTWEQTVHGYKQ